MRRPFIRKEDYRQDALRLARAGEKYWFGRQSCAIEGFAPFVVKLCEAYWDVAEATGNSRWNVLIARTADFVALCVRLTAITPKIGTQTGSPR